MLTNTNIFSTKNIEYICARRDYSHDDIIEWKDFPRYWSFVRGIHSPPVNSPQTGQWRGSIDVFLDLRLNKRFSKQPRRWWFETQSRSLWRHCDANSRRDVLKSRALRVLISVFLGLLPPFPSYRPEPGCHRLHAKQISWLVGLLWITTAFRNGDFGANSWYLGHG